MSGKVTIRLGTEGKAEVKSDFAEIGTAGKSAFDGIGDSAKKLTQDGTREAQRLTEAYQRAAETLDMAEKRKAAASAKLAAIAPQTAMQMRINDATGSGFGQFEGSARASAAAFRELLAMEDAQIAKAQALKAILDPVAAAQDRYNRELAELKTLAPHLTVEQMTEAEKRLKAQLDQNVATLQRNGVSTAAMRTGLQQAGFQVQDFAVQVAGGTSMTRAFSMQAPQMIGSLQLMANGAENGKGKFAQFASFIGGPWGVALGIAIPVAGMLAEKLLDDASASEEAKKAAEEHKKAIEGLMTAMEQSILTAEAKARADAIELGNEREKAIEIRKTTAALLEQARARLEITDKQANSLGQGEGGVNFGITAGATQEAEIKRLESLLDSNQQEIDRLTKTFTIAVGQLQGVVTDQLKDPRGRVNREYDRQRNEAIAGGKGAAAIVAIERARDAELKKIEDANKALREAERLRGASPKRDGADATPAQVSKLLLEAFGGNITSTVGGDHVKGSYHYRGQAVDFVPRGGMGALTKEQIRAVVEGAGLTIKELLGPGDKGHSDHFHVAWSGGRFDSMAKENEEAAKLTIEYQAQSAELDQQLRIQMMRQQGLNQEADKEEARLALIRQFGNLDATRLAHLTEQTNRVIDQKYAWEEIMAIIARLPTDLEIKLVSDADMEALMKIINSDLGERGGMVAKTMNKDMQDLARTINQDVGGSLKGLMRGFGDLGDLALNVLYSIGDSIIDNLLNAGGSGGGSSGGIGGVIVGALGSLFGGGGAAIGTEYASGGAMWLAENGPELVHLPRGSRVTPAAETRRLLSGANDNRAAITFAPVINAPGADAAALARVEAELQQMRRDMPRTISATMMDLDQRSHGRWLQGGR